MNATDVTVREVRNVGADTIAIELATPPEFEADPGAFVLVRMTVEGEEIARHYTLSSPSVDDTFEITVGVDPEGDLTPELAALEPGNTVTVEGPFGNVTYDGDEDVLVLAGGPGVGPAVGIAERARNEGYDAGIVYLDESPSHKVRLSKLADQGAAITLASDEKSFTKAVAENATVGQPYVFGFGEFCELALDALDQAGLDPDDALVESFG